jgi:hypothetical protein
LFGEEFVALAGIVDGADAEFAVGVEDVVELVVVAAGVGRDGRQQRFFPEVETHQTGQVGFEGAAFGEAGADGVGHGDGAVADALDEAGDAGGFAVGGEDDGIDVGVVEAAVDDVDGFEAGDGFEIDAVIDDEEIVAAGEREAHFAGEETVLGIKRILRTGGENDDGGFAAFARGEVVQRGEELDGEIDDAVVIRERAVEFAGFLGEEAAVLHGVTEADGGVGAGVGEEPAGVGFDEVEADDGGGVGACRVQAETRTAVVGIAENDLGREDAGAENFLVVIDVGQEGVDEAGALDAGGLKGGPFGGGQDEWGGLEVPVRGVWMRGLRREIGLPGVANEQLQAAAEGAQLRRTQARQAGGFDGHGRGREGMGAVAPGQARAWTGGGQKRVGVGAGLLVKRR